MNKQIVMFPDLDDGSDDKYTKKIDSPVYEPKQPQPHVLMLYDPTKTKKLIREIDEASLPEAEKTFLRAAAARHTVFHYERIADYYAAATPEAQRLMERSALVIIDFDDAIEQGYIRLCDDIRAEYYEEYNAEDPGA